MSVNFGVLQGINQIRPIETQMGAVMPNMGPAMLEARAADANSFNNSMNTLAGNMRANQLQPGVLQQQQLDLQNSQLKNQSQGLLNSNQQMLNKEQEMKMNQERLSIQRYQERVAAYNSAKQTGGPDAGLQAIQDKFLDQGDPDSALKLAEQRQKLKDRIANNNTNYIKQSGNMVHSIETQAAQNKVPALQVYTDLYNKGEVTKIDPDAPKPESFRNNAQFEETYVHPRLDFGLQQLQTDAAKQKAVMTDQLTQVNEQISTAKTKVQNAVNQYGAKSQEAKDAADEYTAALHRRQNISSGNNYVTGTLRSLGNAGSSILHMIEGKGIQENTPEEIVGKQSKSPANKPITMPTFNSKEEFQSWYNQQSSDIQQQVRDHLGK